MFIHNKDFIKEKMRGVTYVFKKKDPNLFLVLLIIALAGFGWSIAFLNSGSQSTIQIQLDEKKATMESSRFSFKPIDTKTRKGIKSTDTELSYEVIGKLSKIGDLTITIRKLDNGDQFIFNQFASTGTTSKTLPLQISLNGVDSYDFYDFSEKEPVREHDNTFGVDHVTNVKGLYELKEKNQQNTNSIYLKISSQKN